MTSRINDIFPGIDYRGYHIADCPLCGETLSFHVHAGDIWRCVSCNQSGDLDDLKRIMGDDLLVRIEQLDKPPPPEGLIVVGDYLPAKKTKTASTGFNPLDRMLGGLPVGMLTVMTGKRGEGKSTLAGQMSLNLINEQHPVCFYSGELNAGTFQSWVMTQAAGASFLDKQTDQFGEVRYRVTDYAVSRIKSWLGQNLVLYDNGIIKSSERNSILERFRIAKQHYGCEVFFVDNLMTARVAIDQERDYYRAQSNFVRDLVEFAIATDSHVVLIAHPRKSDSGDKNDNVAGAADITNLAHNVLQVSKATDKERAELGCDSIVEVTKGREYGDTGAFRFNFDKPTRRFLLVDGKQTLQYGWEG